MVGWSSDKRLYRLEFYDKNNVLLLKAGGYGGNTSKELILGDNERLIGMKSKRYH
jgi:hypothetical protein